MALQAALDQAGQGQVQGQGRPEDSQTPNGHTTHSRQSSRH